ncbi:DUF6493 family protein, partial [Spirillospora sp. NPDC049652]
RAQDLRWFCALHDELAPTAEESASRLRDLVRMLPAAPGPAADLALREIRRVDEEVPVPAAVFAEAVEAALFRPEKRLVRSALVWANRTARRHRRQDAAVRAVLPLLESEDLALRDRAVKLIVKHAAEASAETREAVAAASTGLPADLRSELRGLISDTGRSAPAGAPRSAGAPTAFLPPYVPPPATPPIGSLGELVEATMLLTDSGWGGLEHVMAGIVEHTYRDPDGTREALSQMARARPWFLDRDYDSSRDDHPMVFVGLAIRAITQVGPAPTGRRARLKAMRSRLRQLSRVATDPWEDVNDDLPTPFRLLAWRMLEAVDGLGSKPFLLAAPTEANGLLDPAVLVERALRYEADGLTIGRADLAQALLRTPGDVDPGVLERAAGLASEHGRTLAEHLAADALPCPEITLSPAPVRRRAHGLVLSKDKAVRLLPTCTPAATSPWLGQIAPLFTLPRGGRWDVLPSLGYWPGYEEIPRMMPSHRELAAAHLLPGASNMPGIDDSSWHFPELGGAVLALAEADGPAGPATAAVLAYAASCADAA